MKDFKMQDFFTDIIAHIHLSDTNETETDNLLFKYPNTIAETIQAINILATMTGQSPSSTKEGPFLVSRFKIKAIIPFHN